MVHGGVAAAREALARPPAADATNPGDGPLGEEDIADDDLGQFIRTPDEIELLNLLRTHLHRRLPAADGEQSESE